MMIATILSSQKLEEFDLVKTMPTRAEAAPTLPPHVKPVLTLFPPESTKDEIPMTTTTNNVYNYYPHCISSVHTSMCSMRVETISICVKCPKKLIPMVPSFNIPSRYSKS